MPIQCLDFIFVQELRNNIQFIAHCAWKYRYDRFPSVRCISDLFWHYQYPKKIFIKYFSGSISECSVDCQQTVMEWQFSPLTPPSRLDFFPNIEALFHRYSESRFGCLFVRISSKILCLNDVKLYWYSHLHRGVKNWPSNKNCSETEKPSLSFCCHPSSWFLEVYQTLAQYRGDTMLVKVKLFDSIDCGSACR